MARLRLNFAVLLVAGCGNGTADPTSTTDDSTSVTTVPLTTGTEGPTPTTTQTGTDPTEGQTSGTMGDTEGATTTMGDTGSTTVEVTLTDTGTSTEAPSSTTEVCPMGTIECVDGDAVVCDGMGGYSDPEACEGPCVEGVGCLLCNPGETQCEGEVSMVCADDGLSWGVLEECDAVQGVSCNPQVGKCDGVCALENLQLSYIGCDYYPTVTQQHEVYNGGTFVFAAVIANTTAQEAHITITRGPDVVMELSVAPDSVATPALDWVPPLTEGLGPTVLVEDGAYRLRSDQPVTVYQYNLLYADGSNDASLLLPVNAWTGEYMVASFEHADSNDYPGFYAVVAQKDGTTVTLVPSVTGGVVQAGGGVAADGTGQVMLNAGDVLEVVTDNGGDLTGTRVLADQPVQVIAGHKCTEVPQGTDLCDHLEEAMYPVEALAKEYIVVPPVQSPLTMNKDEHGQIVRIVASADDTTLTFLPDQGAPTSLAKAGDFIELPTSVAKYQVSADQKILVAQYMVGQGADFGEQDPSMLLAVATEQYREDYLFHAPTSWTGNFVDIVLKSGAMVSVDGVAVAGFIKVPMTDYSIAHVSLSNAGDGNHTVTASEPVGISVYGVQDFGSYWVVGGLDLAHL
jgi:hypothetical protein